MLVNQLERFSCCYTNSRYISLKKYQMKRNEKVNDYILVLHSINVFDSVPIHKPNLSQYKCESV